MKNIIRIHILILIFSPAINSFAQQPIPFNQNWKFKLGDSSQYLLNTYDDEDWRILNLPHDWSIEGEYSQEHGTGKYTGHLPYGKAWYRKAFKYEKPTNGSRLFVQFDGVYMNSEVWINEFYLGSCPYGYTSFIYDLTPFLNEEGENVIAVKVNTPAKSGRWYTGSGIYRNVWLIETPDIYIDHWDPFFTTPAVSSDLAEYRVETKINSKRLADVDAYTLKTQLINKEGTIVSELKSDFSLRSLDNTKVIQKGEVANPDLWSPKSPNVYTLRTLIIANGKEIQRKETIVGIRSLEYNNQKGFLLNGIPTKFKGVNDHHTAGCVGAAIPEDVLYRRLKILKKMGCNAIRTGHNPYAPEFYSMCDTMGFMVMNEAFDGWNMYKAPNDYGRHFMGWWNFDLTQFIKRDRNHPSVVMWSIGNEVQMLSGRWPLSQQLINMPPDLDPTREIQKKLVERCHELDPTRPVTQGWAPVEFSQYLDLVGLNGIGELEGEIERNRQLEPGKLIVGTEVPHTSQTRGVYATTTVIKKDHQENVFIYPDLAPEEVFPEDTVKYYTKNGKEYPVKHGKDIYGSSYGNHYTRTTIRRMWQRTMQHDYFIGMFRWGSFDYLGEATWPKRFADGVIDICGFPKDAFYLYQSLWKDEPMVHMLPHWTHPGKEGTEIPVMVYTNCDSVQLYMNNVSLGTKEYLGEDLVWMVPYKSGTLKAIAYLNNKVACETYQTTAKDPAYIKAESDRSQIKANETDVIHVELTILDKNSVMVPKADNMLQFEITGPIKILGVDNGDPVDLSSYQANSRKAFRGKCLVILQSTGMPGNASLKVKSEGLETASLNFKIIKE
jgi:beta-galactosidase